MHEAWSLPGFNTGPSQFFLTISLPGESKIKIQDESQISFCKILKNK